MQTPTRQFNVFASKSTDFLVKYKDIFFPFMIQICHFILTTTDQLYVLYLRACMHIWAHAYPSEYTEALKTASIITRGTMAVQSQAKHSIQMKPKYFQSHRFVSLSCIKRCIPGKDKITSMWQQAVNSTTSYPPGPTTGLGVPSYWLEEN